jgi:hypothetical protein
MRAVPSPLALATVAPSRLSATAWMGSSYRRTSCPERAAGFQKRTVPSSLVDARLLRRG